MNDSFFFSFSEPQVTSSCVFASLRRAMRAVTLLYDEVLSPARIKSTQFVLLRSIGLAGECAQWQLAEQHAIAPETLSRRLAALRRCGYVQSRRGRTHAERLYSLTPLGSEKLHEASAYWQRAEERLRTCMNGADLQSMANMADHVAEAAQLALAMRMPNVERSAAAAAR